MTRIIARIRIMLALLQKYGIQKTWSAYKSSLKEHHYVISRCPKCGTEHRVHKLRAAYMVRCENCGVRHVLMKATPEETAFTETFARRR